MSEGCIAPGAFAGYDFILTDTHGNVVDDLLSYRIVRVFRLNGFAAEQSTAVVELRQGDCHDEFLLDSGEIIDILMRISYRTGERQ